MGDSLLVVLLSGVVAITTELINYAQKKLGLKCLSARMIAGFVAVFGGLIWALYVSTVPSEWKEHLAVIVAVAWPGAIGIYELLIKPLEPPKK